MKNSDIENKITLKEPFSKFICAASNTNIEQVRHLSCIYSLSGFDIIDICADKEIIDASIKGLAQAEEIYKKYTNHFPSFKKPVIMVSVNAGKDKHFKKAKIDYLKCVNCKNCIEKCPVNAISFENNKIVLDQKTCYGCGRCVKECPKDAISFEKLESKNYKHLADIAKNNYIQAIEIHTGNSTIKEIKKFIKKNDDLFKNINLLSYSVESDLFNKKELIKYTQDLIELTKKEIIIQIDGKIMGANNTELSSIQTIAAAEILIKSNINAKIQLAGGCNHLTKKYVEMLRLNISGIGYGTFAKRLAMPYTKCMNQEVSIKHLKKCVNIALDLHNHVEFM